jgi:hypothetical protein
MAYPGDGRLSVIYVRGRGSGIDRVVDDPFYGFNEGSVHIRVDGAGEPRLLQFESPLLRLITDEGYQLQVHGDQRAYLAGQDDGRETSAPEMSMRTQFGCTGLRRVGIHIR